MSKRRDFEAQMLLRTFKTFLWGGGRHWPLWFKDACSRSGPRGPCYPLPSLSQAAGSYFLSSCSLLLFISSSQQCKGIVLRSMSSSPKTLYWCQRVSHFAKRNFPSRNTIPFEKRPTNQKNKLSKMLPSKTLLNLNLFLVLSSWIAVSISRASCALVTLPVTYKPASVGWLNLATL